MNEKNNDGGKSAAVAVIELSYELWPMLIKSNRTQQIDIICAPCQPIADLLLIEMHLFSRTLQQLIES